MIDSKISNNAYSSFIVKKIGLDNTKLLTCIAAGALVGVGISYLAVTSLVTTATIVLMTTLVIRITMIACETLLKKQNFNIGPINSENRPYGNKYAGLIQISELLKKHPLANIEVPLPKGLSHKDIEEFLKLYASEIFPAWNSLGEQYEKTPDAEKSAFLKQEAVSNTLKGIRGSIEKAFNENSKQLATKEIVSWMEQLAKKSSYLMVRSSSNEDGEDEDVVNAGANLSVSYVEPNSSAALSACGSVVASYFTEFSLGNQFNLRKNPFKSGIQLSVVLQELIGESLDNKEKEIPVSLVLFTSKFLVTTISSSYGHGEGVVNSEDVKTDSIYVTRSQKDPSKLVEIYNNPVKQQRLAPIKKDGKVHLEQVDNPKELTNKRSLSKEMMMRLVDLSDMIEQELKQAMDLEIVIKGNIIHIVQMRAAKKASVTPSYLSDAAIGKLKSSPLLKTHYAKTLVLANDDVQEITSLNSVLFCTSLKAAQFQFNDAQHKVVIVANDEKAILSHPILHFDEKKIPCFYSKEYETLKLLAQQINNDQSLVICPQSGRICLWSRSTNFIECKEKGYITHPAQMNISLIEEESEASLKALKERRVKIPEGIVAAIGALKAASIQTAAFTAINTLKEEMSKLQEDINAKLKTIITKIPSVLIKIKLLKKIEKCLAKALSEIEAIYQNPQIPPLKRLFHIKTLETLIGMNEHSTTFSLMHIPLIQDSIDKEIAYGKKNNLPAPQFTDLLYIRDFNFIDEAQEMWEAFLLSLEKTDISTKTVHDFKAFIEQVNTTNNLASWLTLIFFPTLKKLNSSLSSVEIVEKFIADGKAAESLLSQFNSDIKQKVDGLASLLKNLDRFASIDALWKKCLPLISFFGSDQFRKYLIDTDSSILKLATCITMRDIVQLMDQMIKHSLMNATLSKTDKLKKLDSMLREKQHVLKRWATLLNEKKPILVKIESGTSCTIEEYFTIIQKIWDQIDLRNPENLDPSEDFSVSAAILGSQAAFKRHHPKTLGDIFTLNHQNEIAMVAMFNILLLPPESIEILPLPPLFKKAINNIFSIKPSMVSLQVTNESFQSIFNIPLGNHSMEVVAEWVKESGLSLHIKFLGEAGDCRWKSIYLIANALQKAAILDLYNISDYTQQEIQFSLKITDQKNIEDFKYILQIMGFVANRNPHLLQNQIESVINNMKKEKKTFLLYEIGLAFFKQIDFSKHHEYYCNTLGLLVKESFESYIIHFFQWFQSSYGQSDDPKIILLECQHIHSLSCMLDTTWGGKTQKEDKYIVDLYELTEKYPSKLLNIQHCHELILARKKLKPIVYKIVYNQFNRTNEILLMENFDRCFKRLENGYGNSDNPEILLQECLDLKYLFKICQALDKVDTFLILDKIIEKYFSINLDLQQCNALLEATTYLKNGSEALSRKHQSLEEKLSELKRQIL